MQQLLGTVPGAKSKIHYVFGRYDADKSVAADFSCHWWMAILFMPRFGGTFCLELQSGPKMQNMPIPRLFQDIIKEESAFLQVSTSMSKTRCRCQHHPIVNDNSSARV